LLSRAPEARPHFNTGIRPSPRMFCICIAYEERKETVLVSQKKVSSRRRPSLPASAKVVVSHPSVASPCSPSAGSAEPARRRASTSAEAACRPPDPPIQLADAHRPRQRQLTVRALTSPKPARCQRQRRCCRG
jgi:hypothetical protein